MMRLALSAAAVLAAGTASAQVALLDTQAMVRAQDITGGDIYAVEVAEEEWAGTAFEIIEAEWEAVGEIEDVVIGPDGQVAGIVAEIGGFLGIADHNVFLPFSDVRLVPEDPEDNEYAYVTRDSSEELENLPEVDEDWRDD